MNAYELAVRLFKANFKESAKMILEQADRIAELEKSAEPVAWMEYIQGEEWEVWYVEPKNLPEGHTYKPLYTTPQIKELSDEEIHQIFRDESGFEIDTCPIAILDFARAILKKASEK